MVHRGIALTILTLLALLWGCDAEVSTFAVSREQVGTILDQVVSLQVFPVRWEYTLEGDYIVKTEDHLRVFAVHYNGNTRLAPLQDTEVTLEEGGPVVLTETEPHAFSAAGVKMVTVSYRDQSARYAIVVRSDTVPGYGGEDGGGPAIILDPIW
jgi:hypothetical protein